MREGDRIVRLTSRAPGAPRSLSVVAMPWRAQGVGTQRSAGLLAFPFVRAAPVEANGHVAAVTKNPVIRRVALIPDPAVHRGAGAS